MSTQCTPPPLAFHAFGRRQVVGRFDAGRLTSDGGILLLREVDRRLGLMGRVAGCFSDYRDPDKVEHSVLERVTQRVGGIALGYEDLNDHDALRTDSLLALWAGKADLTGAQRSRERDRGYALAGSSTLNRLELSRPEAAARDRYHRIAADTDALDRVLVDLFLDAHTEVPEEVWLDLDATDDPLHGDQEGRFFHGYYRTYCYLPLYIFCGEHLLCARLRPSNRDASAGSVEELAWIVGRLRQPWPQVRVVVRGDAGFCRESIMRWCEDHDVDYVLGLARNEHLVGRIGKALRKSRSRSVTTGAPSRRFREFGYRTRTSWSRTRRVVAKAEHLAKGSNPRFVVTSLGREVAGPQRLYEHLYCARCIAPWQHGKSHQRMPARPVRRPHQHGDAARQPTAAIFCVFRLCSHARLATAGPGGHALGPGAMRNPAREPAQGRRPDPDHRTQGLAVVLLGLPLPGRVHSRRGGTLSRSDPRTARINGFPPTQ